MADHQAADRAEARAAVQDHRRNLRVDRVEQDSSRSRLRSLSTDRAVAMAAACVCGAGVCGAAAHRPPAARRRQPSAASASDASAVQRAPGLDELRGVAVELEPHQRGRKGAAVHDARACAAATHSDRADAAAASESAAGTRRRGARAAGCRSARPAPSCGRDADRAARAESAASRAGSRCRALRDSA